MTIERPTPATWGTAAASEATAAAHAFLEAHRADADALGRTLADDLDDPASFVRNAETGLRGLSDPACLAGQQFVAPGIGPLLGVRNPLLDAVERSLVREWRGVPASRFLPIADALASAEIRELRWLGVRLLGRIVRTEPERAWQIFRRVAREADDWITVDTTAGYLAPAIVNEPYRWAELEQLVYSTHRWERRLVGATIASIVHRGNAAGRPADAPARSLDLLALLIGDAEPDVQKALSWALRNLAALDAAAVTAFCTREAETAARTGDGHRAWVIRDTFAKLSTADAARLRDRLAGIRRRGDAPGTSVAAATAAAFFSAGLPDPGGAAAIGLGGGATTSGTTSGTTGPGTTSGTTSGTTTAAGPAHITDPTTDR